MVTVETIYKPWTCNNHLYLYSQPAFSSNNYGEIWVLSTGLMDSILILIELCLLGFFYRKSLIRSIWFQWNWYNGGLKSCMLWTLKQGFLNSCILSSLQKVSINISDFVTYFINYLLPFKIVKFWNSEIQQTVLWHAYNTLVPETCLQ